MQAISHRTERVKVALLCPERIMPCSPQRVILAHFNSVLDCARALARSLLACARVHHDRAHFYDRHRAASLASHFSIIPGAHWITRR